MGHCGRGRCADHRGGRERGADNVQISLNRGVLPHEMFMEQIRRFAAEVLPALQAHRIEHVPLVEEIAASRCVVIAIPAKAGIQDVRPRRLPWPPAFAGATDS
jgi:hypothetical protein